MALVARQDLVSVWGGACGGTAGLTGTAVACTWSGAASLEGVERGKGC